MMNPKIMTCLLLLTAAAAQAQPFKVRTLTTKDSIDFAKRIDSLKNGSPGTAGRPPVVDLSDYYTKVQADSAIAAHGGRGGGDSSAVTTLTSSLSISWDYSSGNIATLTLAHNALLSISNANDGDAGYLIVTQDTTGGRTLTLPDGSSIAVNSGANKTTTLGFVKVGGTFKWTGDYVVTTTGSGAASQTGNVINIPANSGGGNAGMEQATTFSAINTANTQTRLIEVAADETNGGKTTYYAFNNKVSPNTLERFTTTTVSLPNSSAIQTTEGQPLTTTEGQTIQYN